ncbi:MAG: ABC transporter ATP-binding protein [Alphaproteobacteria bacterium]|nr:ABC transporter ATP-binding protein [Alphaproteobacteria bacterium]
MAVLRATDVHLAYGPIRAVRGCTFHLDEGETVAIVGANGAGKTTLMRGLCGLLAPADGSIEVLGGPLAGRRPDELARDGLLHIPEGRGTISNLDVLDNLRLAYEIRPTTVGFEAAIEAVFARFPRLKERSDQRAGSLSGGEQQMLALARAIVNRPKVLLVDEPSLGLSPLMIGEVFRTLREFQEAGMSIMLVEQNVVKALKLAHRAYVLRQGEIVLEGKGGELAQKTEVLEAYLGSH